MLLKIYLDSQHSSTFSLLLLGEARLKRYECYFSSNSLPQSDGNSSLPGLYLHTLQGTGCAELIARPPCRRQGKGYAELPTRGARTQHTV